MEIQIVLSQYEVKIAISEYIKSKYGIIQNNIIPMEHEDGSQVDKKIICSGIIEITKPYESEF